MQSFLLIALFCRLSFGRLLHSLPEDTYAFPKYKVSFLSHLPLRNDTAQKWLHDGLRGGELEFLNQPFQSHREIASADADDLVPEPIPHSYSLEQMKMGPNDSYLCLIPKPLDPPASSAPEAEAELEVSPAHSWSLLEPLTGSCLYVRSYTCLATGSLLTSRTAPPRLVHVFLLSQCGNPPVQRAHKPARHGTWCVSTFLSFQGHIFTFPFAGGYKPEEDPKARSLSHDDASI